jgi:hypothetical protein
METRISLNYTHVSMVMVDPPVLMSGERVKGRLAMRELITRFFG